MAFRPGNRTVHCWAQWGAGRFHTASPEVGKPRGLFRQSPPGTLLYGSPSRKPRSPSPGHCGGTGAFALPSRKQESRAGFSSEPAGGTMLHVSPSRRPHSPSLDAVGHWRFCATQPEVGKPRGLSVSACRGHCFMSLRPEIVQSIAGAQWGYGRFRTVPPGMGAMP